MANIILRWAARCAALLVAGMFLLLLAQELINPHSSPPSHWREWGGIVLLIAAIVGMLLAWKWELPGSVLSLATIALFVPVVGMRRYDVVGVIAIPGVLFLSDWMLRRHRHAGGRAVMP